MSVQVNVNLNKEALPTNPFFNEMMNDNLKNISKSLGVLGINNINCDNKNNSPSTNSCNSQSNVNNKIDTITPQDNEKNNEKNNSGDTKNGKNVGNNNLNVEGILSQQNENLMKQKLVKQSLLDRQKRLAFEQQKLTNINGELQTIECALARDVEKLREMIEMITSEIVYYEKDYKAKKKAFLESRQQMKARKQRQKELTGHLHTIISSNEQRKNQKLQELMKQLETSCEIISEEKQKIMTYNGDNKYRFNGFPDETFEEIMKQTNNN